MIADLERFLATERPYWEELDAVLVRLATDAGARLDVDQSLRLHYLYERASSDLTRVSGFSGEAALRTYLETLVARAYAEIHQTRERRFRFPLWRFVARELPRTFRRHARAFALSVAVTLAGMALGGAAIAIDPTAKSALMPFSHLNESPAERVAREEKARKDHLAGHKGTFSASLMTHNTRVAIFTMGLGMSWGVGTILVLFYNGVTLGAVALDYLRAGQGAFLFGWLMPHGVVEIPAILIAGQAGFVLARALIGDGSRTRRRDRLRAASGDIMRLTAGVALMLVWAGVVEAFLSQYHEPVIPYSWKIAFGAVEFAALVFYLTKAGSGDARQHNSN